MKKYKCVYRTEIWIDIEAETEEEAEYKMNEKCEEYNSYLEGVIEVYENKGGSV